MENSSEKYAYKTENIVLKKMSKFCSQLEKPSWVHRIPHQHQMMHVDDLILK